MTRNSGAPQTILWVPGWAASPKTFRPLQQRLDGHDHISIDFRDVATSSDFANRVKRAIPGPTIIIGWSMGAMLALQAAAGAVPVTGVVVISATLRFTAHDRALGWPEPVLRRMQNRLETDSDLTVTRFLEGMFTDPDLARSYIEDCYDGDVLANSVFDRQSLVAGLDYLATTDLSASIDTFTWPVLWLHGTDDTICPTSAARRNARLLPDCKMHEISGGHAPFYEQPDVCAEAIREFLQRL